MATTSLPSGWSNYQPSTQNPIPPSSSYNPAPSYNPPDMPKVKKDPLQQAIDDAVDSIKGA